MLQYLDGLGQVLHDYRIRALDTARLRYHLSRDLSYLVVYVQYTPINEIKTISLSNLKLFVQSSAHTVIDSPANHAHLFRRLA